jgi:hypothetical protein
MMLRALSLITLSLACIIGCAQSSPHGGVSTPATDSGASALSTTLAAQLDPQATGADATIVNAPPANRRIIATAQLQLRVEDFASVAQKIESLAAGQGGYVANSKIDGATGAPRTGFWKIRVPSSRYSDFVTRVTELGELESQNQDSQEVTAEYADLEARIRNKQQEETRLLGHLTDSTGNLNETLTVEKELSRVREEIERMQGRLALLQDQTAMSTVSVRITEVQPFVPAANPSFASRVAMTWNASLLSLRTFGEGLAIAGTACAPWLLTIGVPALFVFVLLRRRFKLPRSA